MHLTEWVIFIALDVLLLLWQWRRYRHDSRWRRISALLSLGVLFFIPAATWVERLWGPVVRNVYWCVLGLLSVCLVPRGEIRGPRPNGALVRVNRFFGVDEEEAQRHR